MIRRCVIKRLLLVLALAGPAGLTLVDGAMAGEVMVKIENFTFDPAEITVKPGTTVTWVNADDILHSVVENAAKFKSKALDTGDKFSMTFTDAGELAYFCGFHNHMTGKVIVKE